MQKFQGSDILQGIIHSDTAQNNTTAVPFRANPKYERINATHTDEQVKNKQEILNINDLIQLEKKKQSSQQQADYILPKQTRITTQEKYKEQIGEINPIKPQRLEDAQEEWYDVQAYERMVKPDFIGGNTQLPEQSTLHQALKSNEIVLLQFPCILPFEQINDFNQEKQKMAAKNLDNHQELLQEYYSEIHDSAGYAQKRSYAQFLANPKNIVGIKLGKMIFKNDGTALWQTGKQVFDIENGINSNISNMCLSIDAEQKTYANLGNISKKFVIKPNIDNLITKKEFYFFSIPYVYFLIAATYRFYQLTQQHQIVRQSVLSQMEEEIHKNYPPSLLIKIIITLWICFICASSMILGFFGLIIQIKSHWFLIWIIPILSQILALLLLKKEYNLNEIQSIYTHRIFWPLQSAFLGVRIFQSYQTIFSDFMILLQFLPSLILMCYGLYRPDDRARIAIDTPRFLRELFKELEQIQFLQKFKQEQQEINVPLVRESSHRNSKLSYAEFQEMLGSNDKHNQEEFLVQRLPDREIQVNRKIVKRFVNENEIIYYYQITTRIQDKIFECERRYPDFISLEKTQQDILGKINQINIKLSRIELMVGEDEYQYVNRRREYIEIWLQEQLKSPTQITKQFLDFLQIDEVYQTPFTIYQSLLRKKQKNPSDQKRQPNPQEQEIEMQNLQDQASNVKDYSQIQFSPSCTQYQYGQYGDNSIEFVINIKVHQNNVDQRYRILKTLSCIRQFINQLETTLGRPLPANLKIPKQMVNCVINEKIVFVDNFFKQLLKNQDYYCSELFDFIAFDIINLCAVDNL